MVGYFSYKRGVRQGDPISHILFCIAEDVLSRGIAKLVTDGLLSTSFGPKLIQTPSHVFYADDILVFCKGIKRELLKLQLLLHKYSQVSSQQIKNAKSKFQSINITTRRIEAIVEVLGFSYGSLSFMYLGVPLFLGKPRTNHLQTISDRIINKLAIGKEPYKCIRSFVWSGDTSVKKLIIVARKKRFGSSTTPTDRYLKSSTWPDIKRNWHKMQMKAVWIIGDG
ncbi:PREDICTED: uncharacterized protein LOC109335458 [Lupinus angustifolius]|uniref:uncharacterized protein LOC109335458 n=1 Tax=Lupinus angustifolius TaxID=3871 RepID=UPI00092E2327|nr:PREDICTED: uncharacterized protein LOC109335458 [Lupinus angustifolius]